MYTHIIRTGTVIVYNGIRNNSPSSTASTSTPDCFNAAVYFTYSLQNACAVLNLFCNISSSSMRPIFHLSQQVLDRIVCAHISTHTTYQKTTQHFLVIVYLNNVHYKSLKRGAYRCYSMCGQNTTHPLENSYTMSLRFKNSANGCSIIWYLLLYVNIYSHYLIRIVT